ncbi:MAG: pyridoxal phosphate-dependent aminotransferase [Bacteroidales bacterium]|nr:pyridoxal phosphate-dependent aminotransferase [Candidatus Sodaliphilus fimicaballi]
MKQTYDFDTVIDRSGTHAVKQDRLTEYFGRDDLLPLWVADMDFAVCPAITQALSSRINNHPIYGYTCPIDSYWQAIIDWQRSRNGFEFTPDEACFIPGIVPGFGLALNFFTRPGDKVLIQEPVYHPFRRLTEGNGRKIVMNELLEDGNGFYKMDIVNLEQTIENEKPALMVLCNPHNPIGITWPVEDMREVARIARKHGVVVISDEIHGDLVFKGNRHVPFATVSDDAAAVSVTFGAPSKTFNIAGIVSSWCVIKNPELRTPFFTWLETNELNSPNFLSMAATEAAYRHGGEWLDQCLAYIEGNIDFVIDYCNKHIPAIKPVKPQASYLVWLDCRRLGLEHEQVVDLFTNKARLALNDGSMFGVAGRCFMRFNVASPRSVIEKALERLCKAVKALK